MTPKGMRWHYTPGKNMLGILQDGCIKPTNKNAPRNEKPAVYFTTEEWRGEGLYRIGVNDDYPLHHWLKICRLAHVSKAYRERLEQIAHEQGSGNPCADWWGTLHPVLMKDWAAVEYFEDGQWVPFGGAQ